MSLVTYANEILHVYALEPKKKHIEQLNDTFESDATDEAIENESEDEIEKTPVTQVSNLLKCPNIGSPRNYLRTSGINSHIFYCKFPKP